MENYFYLFQGGKAGLVLCKCPVRDRQTYSLRKEACNPLLL